MITRVLSNGAGYTVPAGATVVLKGVVRHSGTDRFKYSVEIAQIPVSDGRLSIDVPMHDYPLGFRAEVGERIDLNVIGNARAWMMLDVLP